MNECKGLLGRLFGHNFQPIFETGEADVNVGALRCSVGAAVQIIDAMTPKRWVHTCCQRCGEQAPNQPARKT